MEPIRRQRPTHGPVELCGSANTGDPVVYTSSTQEPTGAFGWDDTASVVPARCVPSYFGSSSYLILTKYNNYAGVGGDGINKVGILDPNDTQVDPITGKTVMKEILTVAGPTPDQQFRPYHPNAVREWCTNTAVIDPFNS